MYAPYPHLIAVLDWLTTLSLLIKFIVLAAKEKVTFLALAIRFSLKFKYKADNYLIFTLYIKILSSVTRQITTFIHKKG